MESKSKVKGHVNGTLNNRIENGGLEFHDHVVNHSNSLSGSQSTKLCYKTNGELIDKSKSCCGSSRAGSVSLPVSEEKENNLNKDIMITDELVRSKAFKWCQDSLGGEWTLLSSKEELIITPVCGGMSNYLYLISLPPRLHTNTTKSEQPNEVLLRIYGEISKSTMDFLIHNSVVFALLAEKQLGPKPYGMYHDGRIEEFIKADPLQCYDLSRPEITFMVSKRLAHFHSLKMPLCKKPAWFRILVRGWMDEAENNKSSMSSTLATMHNMDPSIDFLKEFEMLIKLASELQAPVVFCHNDLQPGNLLYQRASGNKPSSMTVIDWEYAHYNYRGHDMANHFNEWTFDYSSSGLPGYKWLPELFPSQEQQYVFFKSYLEATGVEVTEECLGKLYKETNFLVLHSHFFWSFWSLVQGLTSGIEFDYYAYAICRFEGYLQHKAKLVAMYGDFGDKY